MCYFHISSGVIYESHHPSVFSCTALHNTSLCMKKGWNGTSEGKPSLGEDFSLWVHRESGVPLVGPSGWWQESLETEKAQTHSWCEPGKGLPEEKAGCQNCPPCLKQGIVWSLRLTGHVELLSRVLLPCTSHTGYPGTLWLGFHHQQSLMMGQCLLTWLSPSFLKNHVDCFRKCVIFFILWFCCCRQHYCYFLICILRE